ncbi:hypothetical protein OOT00_12715 [Desulfobotulus sp. H1]|uniref:Uncharacterized protein n=1 Tax=Desulfobotulus pelophilus TaxID=2823377 RepID=A0ABT3NCE3_9BACT|nr:hypothetical protein [Desulfobotulus pelophilus]MCW7754846.1 hypothetical protein [Desulfobotulus pelophilus]
MTETVTEAIDHYLITLEKSIPEELKQALAEKNIPEEIIKLALVYLFMDASLWLEGQRIQIIFSLQMRLT